jgi:hypothetical protein
MAVTGDLGGNPIILENAAEEATLQRLVELFETKFADNSGVKKKEAKATKDSTKATIDYMGAVEKTGQTVKSSFKQITESGEKLGDALQSLAGPGIAAIGGMGRAGRIASVGLTALAAGVGALLGSFDKTGNMFLNLTRSGVSFGGSMIEMRIAANQSGATMDQFTKAVQSNVQGLNRFGGGTTNGALALSRISAEGTRFRRQLVGMGVSVADQTEFFADFMGQMGNAGFNVRSFGGDFARIAAVSVSYRKNLQALGEITGRSVEEQEAAGKQLAQDRAFQAKLATMGPEAASALTALMNSSDATTRQLIKDRITLGGLGPKTAAIGSAFPALTAAIFATADAAMAGNADVKTVMAQEIDARQVQIRAQQAQADKLAALGNSVNNDYINTIGEASYNLRGMSTTAGTMTESLAKVKKAQDDIAAGTNGMVDTLTGRQTSMQDLSNAFENLGTKLVPFAVPLINFFSDAIDGVANFVNFFAGDTVTGKVITGIGLLFGGAAIVAATKAAIGGVGKMLSGNITSMFGMAGGAGGAGAGKAGGGMLAGLAKGMSAFGAGSVKILLGAATIAGVITAIGAGIAGAAYLTGSALPKLVSGMKGIEELDGDRLVSAGKGLAAVSAAMAVMGGGSAVGAIGGLVSKIVSGGDSPADMLTNMAGAIDDFADAIDKLDLAKMTMLAGFVVPGAGELAGMVQDATGGGAATAAPTTTGATSSGSDSTALLQRLLDVQTRQGTETNDLLRRISNDI